MGPEALVSEEVHVDTAARQLLAQTVGIRTNSRAARTRLSFCFQSLFAIHLGPSLCL